MDTTAMNLRHTYPDTTNRSLSNKPVAISLCWPVWEQVIDTSHTHNFFSGKDLNEREQHSTYLFFKSPKKVNSAVMDLFKVSSGSTPQLRLNIANSSASCLLELFVWWVHLSCLSNCLWISQERNMFMRINLSQNIRKHTTTTNKSNNTLRHYYPRTASHSAP